MKNAEWQPTGRRRKSSIFHLAFYILHLSRPPRLVSRQRLLLFREALICLSYSGCLRTAILVVPRGDAPRSSGYQPGALLLSYGTVVNCGFKPNRFAGRKAMFSFPMGRMRMARRGL